jgi:hypothetical protein
MAEEIKVYPFGVGAAFGASEQSPVELARFPEVIDGKRKVKQWCSHGVKM